MHYLNEDEKKSYKKFIFFVRIAAAAFLIFVLGSYLNWRLYGPFMLAKTKNAVKAAERAYIVANDNTYDISADDLEKIKDCFNNADFVYDGREAYPHCGFTKDYAIVFVNKNGTETYACKAMDGDGLMSINGNYYGFETSDIWFRFSEIFEKYGGNFF